MRILARLISHGVYPGSVCDHCGVEIEPELSRFAAVFRDLANSRWIILCQECSPVKSVDAGPRKNYNLVIKPGPNKRAA